MMVIAMVLLSLSFNLLQKEMLDGNRYELVSTTRQIATLVRHHFSANDNKIDDSDLIKNIDKVISVEMILNSDKNGEVLKSTHGFIRENTESGDFKKYLVSLLKLIIKYPQVFMQERYKLFIDSMLPSGINFHLRLTKQISTKENKRLKDFYEMFSKWILMEPLFERSRVQFISFISLDKHKILRDIFWNPLIEIIALFILFIL